MKNNLLRLLALATALLAANSARAGMVTYDFSGTVTTYSPTTGGLPSSILGETATGSFSYEAVSAGGPFYRSGSNNTLQMSMTVTIDNTYTFSLTTLGTDGDEIDLIQSGNSVSFGYYKRGPDATVVGASSDTDVDFLEAFGFGATSTDLATTAVVLESGATIGISDAFSTDSYYFIGITPTSLQEVAPVPEPSSAILLGTGVVGLAGLGWRWKRRVRPI